MQDNQREELSYLAGLFDGEGTLCIQKDTRPRYSDRGWNPVYYTTFRIGMIEQKAIQGYKDYFKIGYVDCEKVYHAFRPMWRYSIRAKEEVKQVVTILLPFLRVKKPQAQLLLQYFEECPSRRGLLMTPEIMARKEYFFYQMKKLNGVDISPATTKRMGRPPSVRVQAIV